ncbi:hypothetical protein NKI32_28300 [Mesorhizobium sp. M0761]|uniref:hypothetical protein n=1 Tax=Mesorhizobium sp. M0761 TaxID=2956994 RepID=UPI003337847D
MSDAGDANFCTDYLATDAEVKNMIAAGKEEFYIQYNNWINASEPSKPSVMLAIFGAIDDAERKLDLGKGSSGSGGVYNRHCGVFNDFVMTYKAAGAVYDQQYAQSLPFFRTAGGGNPSLVAFRVALAKYFAGLTLSEDEMYTINGAMFVQVDIDPVIGSGDKRLFAIPAYALLAYDVNLDDAAWDLIDQRVGTALNAVRGNTINVTGAVHLRLGDDNFPIYKPIVIGDGMVVMGRA